MVRLANQRGVVWVVWTGCLTLVFGRLAAYNLGNYRPVTNDEVELMSVAYKLAAQGVLGSDLFAGFFGADQHYLMTLPLQHVLEAISFRLFGAGVAQARWVSLVAGVALIWIVGWLAWRWYGLATAVTCELLMVALPSNLTAAANGLPLFALARVARYDVLAVAFTWLAIAVLTLTLHRPRPGTAFAVGLCCGCAALTTLTGTFVFPLVVAVWVLGRRRAACADRTIYWLVAGAAVVVLAWVAVALRYGEDQAGQLAVYGGRWEFARPRFYLANLVGEPSRYRHVLSAALYPQASPSRAGAWLLLVGIWPAVAYIGWRCRRASAVGDRILLSTLLTFAGLLALLDQTKTPLYASILVPSLCLALAAAWMGLLRAVWRPGGPVWPRLATGVLSLGLALGIGADAVRAYQVSLTQAGEAGQYLGVGQQIERSLPPGGRLLGPERWWWALRDHPYVSVRSLLFQWSAASRGVGPTPRFVDWVAWARPDSVIVNDNVRGDLLDFPETVQQQFWSFIETCTQPVGYLDDPTYLEIEVYALKPLPRPAGCDAPGP